MSAQLSTASSSGPPIMQDAPPATYKNEKVIIGAEKTPKACKDVHHLDASGTVDSQALMASLERVHGAADEKQGLSNAFPQQKNKPLKESVIAEDGGHTVAHIDISNTASLGLLEVAEARSVTSLSPRAGLSESASIRDSYQSQTCAPAEIETPSSEDSLRPTGALNDSFTQQLMAGALKLKSSLFKSEQISFSDIARNPSLARRARAEMDNHQFKGMIEGPDGSSFAGRPHDLEVTRLQVALDVVEVDAEEESKLNSQFSQLVCLRLDASRKAVERLLGILQAVTAAEAAYTRAMNAVSKVKLVSDCDGQTLRAALVHFSDVPWLVGEAHAAVQNGLVEVTKGCQEMVGELRKESQSISSEAARAHSAVLHARKQLHSSFLVHKSACRAADDAAVEKARLGKAATAVKLELDPWLTESRVVSAHQALHTAQTHQRLTLAAAYERVRVHEGRRSENLKEIAHSFLHSYKGDLGSTGGEEERLRSVVDSVDVDSDLAQFTESAAAAVLAGKELAERQSGALESAEQDLLCSADIIRQGEMARWVSGSGKWADCHCILTRSGFLHYLADMQSVAPISSLNLAKCNFEAGDAPKFNINEHQGGIFGKSRKMCFQAPSVEDCCEWAIALRESIAAHKVK